MKIFTQLNRNIVKGLSLIIISFCLLPFSVNAQNAQTIESGSWTSESVWSSGTFPSYTGELGNRTHIYVDHDVHLIGESFTSGNQAQNLEIHVGKNSAATLTVDGDFLVAKTVHIIVYANSTLQIGVEQGPNYNYCLDEQDTNSLFHVDDSNKNPTLHVKDQGTFIVFGDFKVENKFEIIIENGGSFIIKGSFEAGNSADVKFTGAGGEVGCDMTFDNGAKIHLDVGSLHVGGDLLFGNSGDIYMSGSDIEVAGGICSYNGEGSGAVITLHGDTLNPSTISAGYICDGVKIDEVPGIEIEDVSTLPIELLAFTAEVRSDVILLNWLTATEINNDYFTIERSADLNSWEQVGMVQGAGTTSMGREYSLTDHFPMPGVSYYRLKQTDFDGTFEYFAPVAVSFDQTSEIDFKVLKNGSSWTVVLSGDSNYHVEVYTLSGYRLFTAAGSHNLSIPNPQQTVVIRVLNDKLQNSSRVVM